MGKRSDEKIRFLVALSSNQRIKEYSDSINELVNNATIYSSNDGLDTMFKVDNAPPHILVIDHRLPKLDGLEITVKLLANKKFQNLAIILLSELPDDQLLLDELVTGQVQFLTKVDEKEKFQICLRKSLNFISVGAEDGYRLKYLNPDEVLFTEGETGDCVYIVKKGELLATKNSQVLGKVAIGEFVGEMSHFNGEPRSATIKATSPAELIEIPFGSLDVMLFRKPAWSKALVMTLTKRLKNNASVAK
jgi:CRP/FNR family cyclic AMP-dependent transcriptional regulator